MIDFEINGVRYRAGRMDTFKQFHVARRIAPVLSGMVSLLSAVSDPDENPPPPAQDDAQAGDSPPAAPKPSMDAAAALGPLAEALADMSDENTEYVLKECLRVVSRELDGGAGWAPVTVRSSGVIMGEMDMATMLQIVFQVMRDNLAGFFAALPPMSQAGLAGAFKGSSS